MQHERDSLLFLGNLRQEPQQRLVLDAQIITFVTPSCGGKAFIERDVELNDEPALTVGANRRTPIRFDDVHPRRPLIEGAMMEDNLRRRRSPFNLKIDVRCERSLRPEVPAWRTAIAQENRQ